MPSVPARAVLAFSCAWATLKPHTDRARNAAATRFMGTSLLGVGRRNRLNQGGGSEQELRADKFRAGDGAVEVESLRRATARARTRARFRPRRCRRRSPPSWLSDHALARSVPVSFSQLALPA